MKYRLESRKNRIYRPNVTLCTSDDLTRPVLISNEKFKPLIGKVLYRLWKYNPKIKLNESV